MNKHLQFLVVLLHFCLISTLAGYAVGLENFPGFKHREELASMFTTRGMGIKDNVYSIEIYVVDSEKRFGEELIKGEYWDETILFDDKGRIARTIKKDGVGLLGMQSDSTIIMYNWEGNSKLDIHDLKHNGHTVYKYTFNDNGRLVMLEDSTFSMHSKFIFNDLPNGYETIYYFRPTSDGSTYKVINNQLTERSSSITKTNNYSSNGKILKEYSNYNGTTSTVVYHYNEYGDLDLITKTTKLKPNSTSSTKKQVWIYEYDEHGNWLSRRCLGEQRWIKRKITYMNPSEIRESMAQELQSRLQLRDSLITERENEIKWILDYKFKDNLRDRIFNFLDRRQTIVVGYDVRYNAYPVKSAKREGNLYSFEFADGTKYENVAFEPEGDGYYSKKHDLIMKCFEYFDGHEHNAYVWYVGHLAGKPYERYQAFEMEDLSNDEYLNELKSWDYVNSLNPPYKTTNMVGHESELPSCHIDNYNYVPIEFNSILLFPDGLEQDKVSKLSLILAEQNKIAQTKQLITNAISLCQLSDDNITGVTAKIKKVSTSKDTGTSNKQYDIELKSGNKYSNVVFVPSEFGVYFSEDNRLMLFSNRYITEKNGNIKYCNILIELENNVPISTNHIIQNHGDKNLLPQGPTMIINSGRKF